jgi:carbamoylphosphate synthase large subunit
MKVGSRSVISSEMIQLEQNFIIQDYISAQEITIDAYINSKKNFFTCMPRTRNKVKDGKSVVGQTLNDKKIYEIAKSLLEKLDYQGACNIQLFNDNNLNIIEINPRMSAGGLLLSCEAGLNIPELMLLDYFNYDLPAIGMPLKPITMIRYLDEKFIR